MPQKEKAKAASKPGMVLQFNTFFIKRLVSKEIMMLHREQLYL